MTRTYYIKHETIEGTRFDKITHRSIEDRPNWHKVEALNIWKNEHKGYAKLNINSVLSVAEFKAINK